MKNSIILILSLVISSVFAQDNDGNPINKTKREAIKSNKIRVQISSEYILTNNTETPTLISDTVYFDENGNITKEIYVNNEPPSFQSFEEYTYNAEGKVTHRTDHEFFKGKPKLVEQTFYEYDGNGNLTAECNTKSKSSKYPRSSCSKYIYKDNQLSKYIDHDKVSYYYIHKGDTIFKHDTEENKNIDCYVDDKILMQYIGDMKWVYEYNNNGLLLKTTCYLKEHLDSEVFFEYQNTLLIKTTTKNHSGSKSTIIDKFSYLYY